MADRRRGRHEQGGEGSGDLPKHYYLDESDPDILVLRRQDGTFVAAFSAQGATREGLAQAAREDYRALLARPAKEREQGSGQAEGQDPEGGARG